MMGTAVGLALAIKILLVGKYLVIS